jgi:hypothetical protein
VGQSITELGRILSDRMDDATRESVDPQMTARIFFNALLAFFVEQEILGGKHLLPADETDYIEHLVDMLETRLGADRARGPRPLR